MSFTIVNYLGVITSGITFARHPATFEYAWGAKILPSGGSVIRNVAKVSVFRHDADNMIRIAYGDFSAETCEDAFYILKDGELRAGCLLDYQEVDGPGVKGVLVATGVRAASVHSLQRRVVAIAIKENGQVEVYQVDSINERKRLLLSMSIEGATHAYDNAAIGVNYNRKVIVQFGGYVAIIPYLMVEAIEANE